MSGSEVLRRALRVAVARGCHPLALPQDIYARKKEHGG